nr:tyrosine-protein phosphatase [Leucobacter exalbidus]
MYNFRDIGGMPIAGGGVTRAGVLYRSAALGGLTPNGIGALAATDIGVVVDFRTDAERQADPDRLPDARPFKTVELALLQGAMNDMTQQLISSGAAPAQADIEQALSSMPTLGALYTGMLAGGAAQFAEVAQLIAVSSSEARTAVLVHCTAGKDRTGVATALMLDAVGADRDAIIADYASSQEHLAGPWADGMLAQVTKMGLPVTPALRTLITGTPPEAIEQALSWVDENHGTSADYLRSGGLNDANLNEMRERLVK